MSPPRREMAIRLAVAALLLALGDPLLTALLAAMTPEAHRAWTSIDEESRRWAVGVLAALAWLAGCLWIELRRLRR